MAITRLAAPGEADSYPWSNSGGGSGPAKLLRKAIAILLAGDGGGSATFGGFGVGVDTDGRYFIVPCGPIQVHANHNPIVQNRVVVILDPTGTKQGFRRREETTLPQCCEER